MSRFLAPYNARGPLSGLSLGRADDEIPGNEERLTAFRRCFKTELHNAYPWPHLKPKHNVKVVQLKQWAR